MLSCKTTTRTGASAWNPGSGATLLFSLVLALLLAGFATSATALDDIPIKAASAAEAEAPADACPALTRIKYPWSDCGKGFSIGFEEGAYGEPPESQCRLYMSNGMCAATTLPWGNLYLGLKRTILP
jgi:hypothetical protein